MLTHIIAVAKCTKSFKYSNLTLLITS